MSRWPSILIACLLGAFTLSADAVANCQDEGPYPVLQCATARGTPAWFAPKPEGTGSVSATWWILGAGNRLIADPSIGVSTNPVDGDGFIDFPLPGIFIGVDSGNLTAGYADGLPDGGLDLVDAATWTGFPEAAGGLCFSATANWALPFVDGCSDQNRTYNALGGAVDASDDYIDPYFSSALGGPGYHTDYALVDAPMGVLLTESTQQYFASAFFSSTNRNHNPDDIFDKGYDMGAIVTGLENPVDPAGNDNIVPWQPIPQPLVSPSPVDPNGERTLAIYWSSIWIVRDNSNRPASWTFGADPNVSTLGKDRNGAAVRGVGVMQQPELVSYVVERKPILGVDCDANAPWLPAGEPIVPPITMPRGTPLQASVTVPQDTCVRLTTRFGRVPSETFAATPADAATRSRNRSMAQAGNLGDIGYEVHSSYYKIGGQLSSDRPILKRAALERGELVVEFETLGEMALEEFEVVATDGRDRTRIVATVACAQCSSGIGSEYRVAVPGSGFRAVKSVHIVALPSGTSSNEMPIERAPERSVTPVSRGRAR